MKKEWGKAEKRLRRRGIGGEMDGGRTRRRGGLVGEEEVRED